MTTDTAVALIADALALSLPAACAAVPGGPAIPLLVRQTDDPVDDRDPPALVSVDALDDLTMAVPDESQDSSTLTVGFTITLRRADLPSTEGHGTQQMRRVIGRCQRAVCGALHRVFNAHAGQLGRDGVNVRTMTELTIGEPDHDTDAALISARVTGVFPIHDSWILTTD